MPGRAQWKVMRWAVRILGCVAAVGALALGLQYMIERGFVSEYSTAEQVRAIGRQLALWLMVMLALLLASVPVAKRIMNSESWPEVMSWMAASFWQGARIGLIVAVALGAAALFIMGLWF